VPPAELAAVMRTETFDPPEIAQLRSVTARLGDGGRVHPVVRELMALWTSRRREIERVTARTMELADLARTRRDERVMCHADIHPWNVLITPEGGIALIDWDDAKLAPRERDLMLIDMMAGAEPETLEAFRRGYGPFAPDPVLIAFYQHERLIQDLVVDADVVLDDAQDLRVRAETVAGLTALFRPNHMYEAALRSDALVRDEA
jgi:spectinomycin phosphotransferase